MKHKKAITFELKQRYNKATKKQKGAILDEFVNITGYNRKYAARALALCPGKVAGYKGKNKFEFYNNLFNYSLKIIDGDVGYRFKKSPKSGYGITRSFFFNKKTYDLLHSTYKRHNSYIEKYMTTTCQWAILPN